MFNNQIYGLTKGQYSPTSELGKVTKSSPFGSLDHPFNPMSVALGAEATFVARTHDMDRKHMIEMFRRAHEHQGASFVEVYQNCNVFNDGAFEAITAKDARADMLIDLHHGEPIRFGADGQRGVVLNEFGEAEIVDVADVGEDRLLVHDEHRPDPTLAFALLAPRRPADHPDADRRVPRRRARRLRRRGAAPARRRGGAPGPGDLATLIGSGATWEVGCSPATAAERRRLATASEDVEPAEHQAGARLGREERRLLRHAHARERGRADLRDRYRPQQDRGVGRALVDERGDGLPRRRGRPSVGVGERRGRTATSKRAESTVRSSAGSSASARPDHVGSRARAARARRRRRARAPPSACMRRSSSRRASGVFGAERLDVEGVGEGGREVGAGGPASRAGGSARR